MNASPSANSFRDSTNVTPIFLTFILACILTFWAPISTIAAHDEPTTPGDHTRGKGLSSHILLTEQEQAWLDRRHTVRVRVANAPPYHMATPEPQGISVDYLKLIGKRFGINFTFVNTTSITWKEAVDDLMEERKWLDLLITIKRTPERERAIAFTADYLSSPWVIINRTDSDFITHIRDLDGKKVAVENGYVVKELLEKEHPQIKIVPFTTSLEALQSVASGTSDAYIANLAVASYLIRDKGLSNLKVAAPTPFGSHDQAMGVRKDWPELASIISKCLSAMSDAEKSDISNRWLSIKYEYGINIKKVWLWIAGLAAAFTLIIAVTLVWNRRFKREIELQSQLIQASHEWQSTFDSISDSIALIDYEQRIMRCNLATSLMLGLEFKEIIGQPCWKLFHGTDASIPECPMEKAKLSLHSEKSVIHHGDQWLEVTVDPIISGQDVLTGAVHIVRDVTEQVTLNNSIKEINDLFTLFMKHSPIYTFIKEITDTESRILQVSDNYRDMIGINAHDMIGKNMHQLFPTEFADKITADDQRVVASKSVLRLEEFFNDGSYITYKFPIDRADGQHLLAGYSIDITDQKRLETELMREKSLYEDLVDTQPAGMYRLRVKPVKTCDANGWRDVVESHYSVDVVSARFCEITGMDMVAFKEKPGLLVELIFPEDRPDFTEKNALALTNLTPFKWEGRLVENNNCIRWIRFESTPRRLDNDEVLWTGVVSNITEQKLSELALRDIQTQLMQNDKLATIGQLAAGVAHEINNPIGFVSSNMMTLAKYVEKYNHYIELLENEIRNYSDEILPDNILEARKSMKLDYVIKDITVLLDENNEGIERVKRIVSDLRTFSRADSLAMNSADLNSCMDSTINIVINEIKYSAELNRHYGNLPKVSCNVQQISQVFMNLLVNAAHAIQAKGEEVGEIAVRTWCDQDNVFVSVSDTGCGITPENCSKIFDAFFTTKEVGKGTGLGLSISSGIIRKHGGEITLSSEVGVGSTFTVRLPLKQTGKSDGT